MKKVSMVLLAALLVFALTMPLLAVGQNNIYKLKDAWYIDIDECGNLVISDNKGDIEIEVFIDKLGVYPLDLQRELAGQILFKSFAPHEKCPVCLNCLICVGCVCEVQGISLCPPCLDGQGNNHTNCFNGKTFNPNSAWHGFVCECECND
jgi:hypothetical protein